MATKIGVVSQKGGVGKSTVSRLLAVEFARNEWDVLIADTDTVQATSSRWNDRRLKNDIKPVVDVATFNSVERALKNENNYDLVIFDGSPHATSMTLSIARIADLVIIPTGVTVDDLQPSVILANELKRQGVDRNKIMFVFNRVALSQAELREAYELIENSFYACLGDIPEKTGYHRALDAGMSLTETGYPSLNERADAVVAKVADRLSLAEAA